MASSSSEPGLKAEVVGISGGGGCGGGGGGGGGGEVSEAIMPSDQILIYRGLKKAKKERGCTAKERISKMPPCAAGKRSSIYRGVTRHRWTGRYEAHLWDKSTWNQNQNKKGKQVYLGAYDDEEAAARAYDLAALKYWGPGTLINFPVTDYSRDLEEMQNVSREDYLASLRRKSSGFSRGIAKYRGLSRPTQSSRWETSFGQVGGPNYFNGTGRFGECSTTESEYPGGFCIERKIDLTSYIKWWGANKIRRTSSLPKPSDETKHGPEDIGGEMKILELRFQPTEPYQMPHLGLSHGGKKHQGSAVSALSILSRSAAYKSLQEKASKEQNEEENNHEIKINEMEPNKVIQESSSGDGGSERLGVTVGMNWLPFQRPVSPLSTFLSAPLLTNYNTMDPLADPILWTNLVSVPMTSGLSLPTEVTKTEATSTYSCFHPEE